jgi:hypothetical protein
MVSKKPQKELLRRYTSFSATVQLPRSKELTLLNPSKWDDRNDAYFLAQYARRKKLNAVLAACFAKVGETYHHWKVFSHGLDGVCIEFHGDKLRRALKPHKGISFGDVKYRTLLQIRENPRKPMSYPSSNAIRFATRRSFGSYITALTTVSSNRSQSISAVSHGSF